MQRLYQVDGDKKFDLVNEVELETGEDAPMSMAAYPKTKEFVCGINSAADKLKDGANQNCRVYTIAEQK